MSDDKFASIEDSAVKTQRQGCFPIYQYRYYYDKNASGPYSALLLIVVGTAMSVSDYSDLAKRSVLGQSIVFCMVDNNPFWGLNLNSPVKLSGEKAADAFNGIYENLSDQIEATFVDKPKIVVGGHSAGGSAAIDAMSIPSTNPKSLTFIPDGYIGIDPFGSTPLNSSSSITTKTITVPTLAWGFTETTCAVEVDEAAKAAYNVCNKENHRVFFQTINPKDNNQIAHCIFTDAGCFGPVCPSHSNGAWVRQAFGNSVKLFAQSLMGTGVSKSKYEDAVPTANKTEFNLFCDGDSTGSTAARML